MKILMTADTLGGVWTYATELTQGLAARNVSVAIATMGPRPTDLQRKQLASISGVRLFESDYKLEWMDSPWQDVELAAAWLLELERVLKPDVVHLNGYALAAEYWEAPTVVAAHSCVLSWWLAVNREPAPAEPWRVYRQKVKAGLRAADSVVAPTRSMLQALQELYGALNSGIVIRNGIASAPLRDSNKDHVIIAAGRLWDRAKNVSVLDRVASQLCWPVWIAGSTKGPEDECTAGSFSSSHLLGELDRASFRDQLSRSSIFCSPALYEPFGLSVLEAASAGCALVLGDIPSLREIWDGAAAFVRPDDEQGLVSTLNSLIDDAPKRNALATAARKRSTPLSREAMAQSYFEIYSQLATGAFQTGNVTACVS